METLQFSRIFCCKSSLNLTETPLNSGVLRQLGIHSFSSRRSGNIRSLAIRTTTTRRRSITRARAGGPPQDGSSTVEDDKQGLLLGTERDDSGSIVGFQLIPQSGMYVSLY